jgi:histone H3/H4
MEKEAPRRPLTPFFMFREKEKEKGTTLSGVDAGERWRNMSDEEKKPYIDAYKKAREKYDRYLEEQGIPVKTSSKKKEKPTKYRSVRIRTVCGKTKDGKAADTKVYQGLAKVAEAFIMDLGKAIGEEMKSEERRTVTVEMMAHALEDKKFSFLTSMEGFDEIIKEAEDATEKEHEKRSQARKKKGDDEDGKGSAKKRATSKKKGSKKSGKSKKKSEDDE